jgi:O-antigen/teichoic acid export membrane protein
MIKDFVKDAIKYLPAQVVPGIVGFISIPIITRLFVPEDYGNYTLVMATVAVLTTILGWLPTSIIRFYPAYERNRKLDMFYGNIINLNFISILAITLIALICLYSIKTQISSKLYLLMYFGIGVFAVTSILNVLQYFLRSKRQINWYSGFAVCKSIGSLGIALLLIFFLTRGIESLLLGAILCAVIILPLLWKKAVGNAFALHFKIDYFLTKEMLKYSFPLVAGNLAAWILSLSDRYILGLFRAAKEVGIYSASYNIADRSIMLLATLFMLASGPLSIHIWEKGGETESKEFLNKITRYFLIICIPAVIGLSVLSKPIINIMTGEQYYEGYRIIPFVAFGILFLGLQQRFQAGFLFYKRTSFITFAIVLSGLINLGLNLLFIPKYGYTAAALTTLISYTFLFLFMVVLSRRFFVWKFPFKSLVKVSLSSAIMGIVLILANVLTDLTLINLILSVFLGGFVYLVLLFLFREFYAKEKQIIKQYFLKLSLLILNTNNSNYKSS